MEGVDAEIAANRKKLEARFGNKMRTGGKGTPRIVKKAVHKNTTQEDGKLKLTLKKLGCQPMVACQEINFFTNEETIYHFTKTELWISPNCNTTAIFGTPERKKLSELLPGIINQLGLGLLNQAAEAARATEAAPEAADASATEEVPDLVENFEEVSKQ